MTLLEPEHLRRFAEIGCQDGKGFDAIAVVKIFDPCSQWTWFAVEFDPQAQELFCFVIGFESEWGWVSLEELSSVKGPLGIGLERDLSFTEQPLREALKAVPSW